MNVESDIPQTHASWATVYDGMSLHGDFLHKDGIIYGEYLSVYKEAGDDLPWDSDIYLYFQPSGFRAIITNPVHDSLPSNTDPDAPFTHETDLGLTAEYTDKDGIDAERRHRLVCGLARAIFEMAEDRLP